MPVDELKLAIIEAAKDIDLHYLDETPEFRARMFIGILTGRISANDVELARVIWEVQGQHSTLSMPACLERP